MENIKRNKSNELVRRNFLIFLLISGLDLLSFSAVYPISKLKKSDVIDLEYFIIYEDSSREISLNSVMKGEYKETIKKVYYYENLNADYVLVLDVFNDTKEAKKWVLEFLDPHISILEFHQKGSKDTIRQGFSLPFENKFYQHKNHVFDLVVSPNDTARCYIKLHSDSHVAFSAKLQTNNNFTQYSLSEYILLGIFYGFLIIMALYNVILYFFTKMQTRLYYTLYVFSCIFSSLAEDGLGFQYIWYNLPQINLWLADIQPIFYLIFYLIYSLSFLDINQNSTDFKRQIILVALGYSILHLTSIYFHFMPKFWVPFYFIPFLIIWNYSFIKFKQGIKSMRFLLLGSTLIIISFVIFYMRMLGLVENTIYVVYFFNFAVVIEIILFSIAVGDKLRASQFENLRNKELIIKSLKENEELSQKVNKELEEKVSERTKDLIAAKQKMEKQAEEITKMNLQLDLHNRSLSKKVVEVSKKRVHSEAIDPEEFHEMYPNKLECYKLLEEIKWKQGFKCRKCTNTNYTNGATFRSRRCTKCGTNESPTSNTIFHGLRIPIEKAFYVFALIVQAKGDISSVELEEKTGVNQKVCWSFKQKIAGKINVQKNDIKAWDQLIF